MKNLESYQKINNFCLMVLAGTAITVVVIKAKAILIPFVFAIYIYTLLYPGIDLVQKKWKLPRILALELITVFYILVLVTLFLLIMGSLENFFESTHRYNEKMMESINWAHNFMAKLEIDIDEKTLQKDVNKLPFFSMAKSLTSYLVSFAGNALLVIIFVIFMVSGRAKEKENNPLIEEVQLKISRYVACKCATSLTTGAIAGVVLQIAGVELAFMFAILTVLLNFIPNIGSIIATLMVLPVLALQFGTSAPFWIILVLLGVVQFTIGNFIEPKLMGENLGLHPVTILVFLMFWGYAWGFAGMFLAVPLTCTLKIVLENIDSTKPLAEILAGRI